MVARNVLVRATAEICSSKEMICVQTEAWLKGSGGCPFSAQAIQVFKDTNCWK